MNLEDFISLSNNQQLVTVLEAGIYISSYTEEDSIYDIYQLGEFYIKIITDQYNIDGTRIITFTDFPSEE